VGTTITDALAPLLVVRAFVSTTPVCVLAPPTIVTGTELVGAVAITDAGADVANVAAVVVVVVDELGAVAITVPYVVLDGAVAVTVA